MNDSEIAQQYAEKILYISDLVTKVRWMTSKEHERRLFERLKALHEKVTLGR
jgi:hypothetical protein